MGIKITFLKILNSLQPDELVITLSPLLSGKKVFMIISKQETLATAACFHYVTNHPRAPDLKFVKNFAQPNFWAKHFTH